MIAIPNFRLEALARVLIMAVSAASFSSTALADAEMNTVFGLRNHNPFLQIFGLPPFQSATISAPGETDYSLGLDLANNADFGDSATEDFLIDGESYFINIALRRRVKNGLELGADVTFVSHDGGFMDGGIKNWHDLFGMSNTKRRGADDVLQFVYQRDGVTQYELNSSSTGIGDLQLSAAIPLRQQVNDGYALTLRTSIKLPTGDDSKLTGSGAADFAAGLYASDTYSLMDRPLGLTGFAGAIVLGDGDVLPTLQRDVVPFGGLSASWWLNDRFAATVQLQSQGAYFDSNIEELGGSTIQLDVGFSYRPASWAACLKFAVIEDVQADATTDFGLHFAVDSGCGSARP